MKELVIKIPEEVLSFVYQFGFIKKEDRNTVHHAILQCVELPKGHGRLIDADAVINQEYGCYWETETELNLAPTLVEADKGE